jgi:hypothetical protein
MKLEKSIVERRCKAHGEGRGVVFQNRRGGVGTDIFDKWISDRRVLTLWCFACGTALYCRDIQVPGREAKRHTLCGDYLRRRPQRAGCLITKGPQKSFYMQRVRDVLIISAGGDTGQRLCVGTALRQASRRSSNSAEMICT